MRYLLFLTLFFSIPLTAQIRYWAVNYADHIQEGSKVLFADEGYTWEQTREGFYLEKFYYRNHQLRESVSYADRRRKTLDGPWRTYYENGQEQVVGTYVENQRTGKWYEYYEDGELWRYCLYEEDIEIQCDTLAWIIEDVPWTEDDLSSLDAVALYTAEQVDSPPLWRGCPDSLSMAAQAKCTDEALYSFAYHELPLPQGYSGTPNEVTLILEVEIDGRVNRTRLKGQQESALVNWVTTISSYWPLLTPAMKDGRPVRCEASTQLVLR